MNSIVDIARSYVGKRENADNRGFEDSEFQKKMKGVGYYDGAPWCGFFARLVWKEAGELLKAFDKENQAVTIVSPSAVKTMTGANRCDRWKTYPIPGSVAVWRTFKGGYPKLTGHMGIVASCEVYAAGSVPKSGTFTTIEGNTDSDGDREGDSVLKRTRTFNWTKSNGLRLMGFVHPE